MSDPEKSVYGLVLAGGKSRRMGHDKALLDRRGQSQLAYIASLVESTVDKMFVSSRQDQSDDKERARFPQIIDRFDNLGPIAGILSALQQEPDVDWLVVACDLPNIDKATLDYLLDEASGEQPFTAYQSSYDGLPEPLCAVYHSGCMPIIEKFIADGVKCPRKILIRADTRLLTQRNPASLDNINTPDDLQGSVLETAS